MSLISRLFHRSGNKDISNAPKAGASTNVAPPRLEFPPMFLEELIEKSSSGELTCSNCGAKGVVQEGARFTTKGDVAVKLTPTGDPMITLKCPACGAQAGNS